MSESILGEKWWGRGIGYVEKADSVWGGRWNCVGEDDGGDDDFGGGGRF
jgi:hypothetical protein